MSVHTIKPLSKNQIKVSTSLLMVLVLLLPPLVNVYVGNANAGTFTAAKVLINNSQSAATNVSYNFRFTASTTTAIKQINIKFCTTPGAYADACTTPTGIVTTGAALANDNIAGTTRTNTFTGNGVLQTVITTPASQATAAMVYDITGITNPTTANTSSYARVITYSDTGTTEIDSVSVAFAVLDSNSIAVSATIDPNFTFSVAGVASGGNFNGGTGNLNVTSTTTTIPFGNLNSGVPKIAAHDVTVSTNASNGYTVTASHSANIQGTNAPLISGATNNIDSFTGNNTTPTTWSAPGGTSENTNTGFFGYSTEDATLCTGTAARFTTGGAKWAGSTTTGQELICNATGVTSQTTRIGWEAEVNGIQPGGTYTGTVILVATPTY